MNIDYQEDSNNEADRIKVISAIIADNKLRYAGTSVPQKSGRFNIPLRCVNILNPKVGEYFAVVKDDFGGNGSVIIVSDTAVTNNDVMLSRVRFGTGKKKLKKRIRLNQKLASMFGVCELGFSVCDFRGNLALRVSPRVPEPDLNILKTKSVEDLAKYVLWPGRSLKVITIANESHMLPIASELNFKLLGGYFLIQRHSVPGNRDTKEPICKKADCQYCEINEKDWSIGKKVLYPLHYQAIYIPVLLDIVSNHPRPGLFKFTGKAINLGEELMEEMLEYNEMANSTYWSGPSVNYDSKVVWKIYNDYANGKIKIESIEGNRVLTEPEKGWVLTLRKKFKKIISEKENIPIADILTHSNDM